ncbi:Phosphomannomutase/phosphoglucomutase [BD1-7 clade bacterium]|uniref:phosphomannomutase n=1 Tax=BD1-7 clade bacterium TaxID=2029982 RepID=A0A5S9QBZ8_9GAMM|nr:Phosphomannomutase/phosphoglucomutase [BD1-7 clade bacterium]
MNKKKNKATKNTSATKKTGKKISPVIIAIIAAAIVFACAGGGVAFLQATTETDSLAQQRDHQRDLVGQAAEQAVIQRFEEIHSQANSIANDNPRLLSSLSEFMAAFKKQQAEALKQSRISKLQPDAPIADTPTEAPSVDANDPKNILIDADQQLQREFSGTLTARLLPWTYAGSAGLKNQALKLRNNMEIHLFANAGDEKHEAPRIYKVDDQWVFSMAYPVKKGEDVKGVILLTYPARQLQQILNKMFLTEHASLTLELQPKNQRIFKLGTANANNVVTLETPLHNTSLKISSRAPNPTGVASNYQAVYGLIIAIAVVSAIACLAVYFLVIARVRKDAAALEQFLIRLEGLHQGETPEMAITPLQIVANQADKLRGKVGKNTLTASTDGNMETDFRNAKVKGNDQSVAFSDVADMAMVEEQADEPEPPAYLHLFRDYDIRGNAEEITDELAVWIGQALGTEALERGLKTLAIAGDCRLSTARLKAALIQGVTATGCDVVDVGQVPSPVLYFATHHLNTQAGIMVTGSHNPKDHNGFKMLMAGQSLHGEEIQQLASRIQKQDFKKGQGQTSSTDLTHAYIDEICTDVIAANPMKIVVDGSNGAGGEIACSILEQLDCEVVPLYCEMDGNFPNHDPDPCNPDNLQDLIQTVKDNNADMGIALDGDADRMVAVTQDGTMVDGDQLMMIFAADVVSRNPASTVVYDIKCSRHLNKVITENGGRPVLWKTGHSNIKAKMQETGALLGGEFTGHFCFKERWYGFDDGIYSAMRLIELLTMDDRSLDERIGMLPTTISTPEMVLDISSDAEKFRIMEQLSQTLAQTDGNLIDIDGVRIEYNDGWGLVRASNTGARLTARFEGDSQEALERIKHTFSQALAGVDSDLAIP